MSAYIDSKGDIRATSPEKAVLDAYAPLRVVEVNGTPYSMPENLDDEPKRYANSGSVKIGAFPEPEPTEPKWWHALAELRGVNHNKQQEFERELCDLLNRYGVQVEHDATPGSEKVNLVGEGIFLPAEMMGDKL